MFNKLIGKNYYQFYRCSYGWFYLVPRVFETDGYFELSWGYWLFAISRNEEKNEEND